MIAKVTVIFIDPMGEWLLSEDYDAAPPIPRIGECVTIGKHAEHRRVTDVVYVYSKDMPHYVMIAVHVGQIMER
jgi:hypothetical protein